MALSDSAQAFFQAINSGQGEEALRQLALDPALANAINGDGVGPISAAIYSFNMPVAHGLVSAGIKPTFYEACALGDLGAIRAFLEADASLINSYAPDGFTALTLAAAFGGPEAVRVLMERGADPELKAKHSFIKVAPLHAAVFGNRTDVVAVLLEKGADPNSAQPGGFTALHGAAQNGNEEMASMLMQAGAQCSLKTEEGKTPAMLAQEAGHTLLAETLNGEA